MSYKKLKIDPDFPAFYSGDAPEVGYPGTPVEVVNFSYVERSEYTRDPEDEIQESEDPVASNAVDSAIGWSDAAGVRATATAVLVHYLGEEPTDDQVAALVEHVGDTWSEQGAWNLSVNDLCDVV